MKNNGVPTQEQRVLTYITENGSITRAEAMSALGIANLPAVINVIRRTVDITTLEVDAENRYGEKVTYAKYVFTKKE